MARARVGLRLGASPFFNGLLGNAGLARGRVINCVEMTVERLREVHRAEPFRPFTLHLADGGRVRVSHPESLAYSPTGRTVVVVTPDDTTQFIDLLLVSRIEIDGDRRRSRRPD